MKLHHLSALLLLVSFFNSCDKDNENLSSVHLERGLIAYFPFNGNTQDESVNNNHGLLVNGSTLSFDENGRPAAALNCMGNGQKMLVPNDGNIKYSSELTVSFHAMPRAINRSNIIGYTQDASGKGTSFVIGPALPGTSNILYSVSSNAVTCDVIQNAGQVNNVDPGVTLQPESWYHILCTYNKGVMKMYINGELKGTQNSMDQTMQPCPSSQLLVGGWWSGDQGASFNGKIDEVRLYNREVNAKEIKELSKSFQ